MRSVSFVVAVGVAVIVDDDVVVVVVSAASVVVVAVSSVVAVLTAIAISSMISPLPSAISMRRKNDENIH